MSYVDPRLLLELRHVVLEGSMSAAAQRLRVSQPSVTAHMRELEERFGRTLLRRTARGVTPTSTAKRLVQIAARVEALLAEAASSVQRPVGQLGELVIGCTSSAGYVLPRLVRSFRAEVGPVRVRLSHGNSRETLRAVADGVLPLAVVAGVERARGLRLQRLQRDELVPVVASDAPATISNARRPEDLHRVPIVWREPGSSSRAAVERMLKRRIGERAPLDSDVEAHGVELAKLAVMAGLGIGFLSRTCVASELALGLLRVAPIPTLVVPRALMWVLGGGEVGGVAGEFLRFARRELAATR